MKPRCRQAPARLPAAVSMWTRPGRGALLVSQFVLPRLIDKTHFSMAQQDVHHLGRGPPETDGNTLNLPVIQGTSTAAPLSLPARRRSRASLARSSASASTLGRIPISPASARNSTPSRRVRLATERTDRSPQSRE
jgi:hypothetical protein